MLPQIQPPQDHRRHCTTFVSLFLVICWLSELLILRLQSADMDWSHFRELVLDLLRPIGRIQYKRFFQAHDHPGGPWHDREHNVLVSD